MEQRRFFEVRSEKSGEWLVLDGKHHPPRVICRCSGWHAPKNAALIATALEAYNSEFYSKFHLGGLERLKEPTAKAPNKAKSRRKPKTAARKSGARRPE
jgi:hypothetical protein